MKKKILVVDDEKDYVELIKNILTAHGYEVNIAYNGEEAMDAVNKEKPDLIILDIKMPKMNGYQVCELLGKDLRYRDIPFLMLTACGDAEEIKAGMKLGAVSYLVKPFKQTILLGLVQGLVDQALLP